jgi:protein-tyrosine phosphatase
MLRVLFVCTGNICRSPTAGAVLRRFARDAGLGHLIEADSAGTHDYHVGEPADRRSAAHARRRGYDLQAHRARQVSDRDFQVFDVVIAMDRGHKRDLTRIAPPDSLHKLELMMRFAGTGAEDDVPDPYYGGEADFERVLDLVERAANGLLGVLAARLGCVDRKGEENPEV